MVAGQRGGHRRSAQSMRQSTFKYYLANKTRILVGVVQIYLLCALKKTETVSENYITNMKCNVLKNNLNLWGLNEKKSWKERVPWPTWSWRPICSCIGRNDKVSDANAVVLRKDSTPVLTITVPPELGNKTANTSPHHATIRESSPQMQGVTRNDVHPPRSSGSDSSGYFTPPPETQQAFVKLDTEDHSSDVEEINLANSDAEVNNNNNSNSENVLEISHEGSFSASSQSDNDNETTNKVSSENHFNNNEVSDILHREQIIQEKHVTASLDELDFIDTNSEDISKSKSLADIKNFLPELPHRKNISSAPATNEDIVNKFSIILDDDSSKHSDSPTTLLPGSTDILETKEVIEVTIKKECTTSRLPRRFSRSLSKQSIRSLSRSDSVKSVRPSSKARNALTQALLQMESNEWEVTVQGLQNLTKVIQNHPDAVEAQMHAVCVALAKHIKNLRSQVARTACFTATELFASCKKGVEMEVEELAGPLLQRTADTNRFLRADANSALDMMCAYIPPARAVMVITGKGCTHQNAVVRAASARLLTELVSKFGAERVMQFPKEVRDRILLAGANELTDGNLETRKQAKSMLSVLVEHQHFQRALIDAVPPHILRHIAKTLNSLKQSAH